MTAKRIGTVTAALMATATLTACGGGSGDGGAQPPSGAHPPLGEGETVPSRIGGTSGPADATVFTTDTVVGVGVSNAERGLATTHLDSGTAEVRMFRAAPDAGPTVAVTWESDTVTFEPEHTLNPRFNVQYHIDCQSDPAPSQCGDAPEG